MKYVLINSALFLLLLACAPEAGNAAAPVAGNAASIEQAGTRVAAPVVLAAESWFSKFYRGLVNSLGSRKAMFQFAMVGMLVALWIIWWRK